MLLIADSGSTKCDWVLVSHDQRREFITIGLNPFFHTSQDIQKVIGDSELHDVANEVKKVFFYGAGCSSDDRRQIVYKGLSPLFVNADITIDHDLQACALATYEGEPSISCILGTGSNSCFYDGSSLYQHVPSLGFILGDEASGTYFGKKLVSDFLYKRMPEHLQIAFHDRYSLTKDEVLMNVYKKSNANVFLASFTPFIIENRAEPYVKRIIEDGFRFFLEIHVLCFDEHRSYKTHFIGSIAYLLRDELQAVCLKQGLTTGRIIQKPIDGLVEYHIRCK